MNSDTTESKVVMFKPTVTTISISISNVPLDLLKRIDESAFQNDRSRSKEIIHHMRNVYHK